MISYGNHGNISSIAYTLSIVTHKLAMKTNCGAHTNSMISDCSHENINCGAHANLMVSYVTEDINCGASNCFH